MRHLRLRIAMLVALVPSPLLAWQQKTATVEFFVTDGWGNAIAGGLNISIRQAGGATPSHVVDYWSSRQVRLPKGEYTVVTEAQGFIRKTQQLTVGVDDLFVPIALVLAPVEGRGVPFVQVSGKLGERYREDSLIWVRVVGLYTGVDRVAKVKEDGTFVIKEVPPGRYVVSIFSKGVFRGEQSIDVWFFPAEITLE
jgi:hypothetical protein